MSSLLHVVGSPRSRQSVSRDIAEAYVRAYCEARPATRVDTLDVWQEALPAFDEHAMAAKYAGIAGTPLTARQAEAWEVLQAIAARFHAAEIIVVSTPMWNFGIPYRLKHLIDLVSQKNILFTFDAQGFGGMLRHAKGLVVSARGLNYATDSDTPESEFDYQTSYLKMWLKFVGITDVATITVAQTLYGPDADAAARQAGIQEALRLARA